MPLVNGSFCGKLGSLLRGKKIKQMHLLWHLQQVITAMAQMQKIAKTFFIFWDIQEILFSFVS